MTDENNTTESSSSAANAPPIDNAAFQIPVNLPPNSSMLAAQEYYANAHRDLQAALLKVAPVTGISGNGSDVRNYRIDLEPTATQEQLDAVTNVLLNWPATYTKQLAERAERAELETWFNDTIAAGFIAPAGYRLGLTPDVVTLITGNYIMAQSAVQLGLPITLLDADGVMQFFADLNELTTVMLAYGQHRAFISADYAARKAAIDNKYAAPSATAPE